MSWTIIVNRFEIGDEEFEDVLYFESRPGDVLYLEQMDSDSKIPLGSEDSFTARKSFGKDK
jgi:hypothetical protein